MKADFHLGSRTLLPLVLALTLARTSAGADWPQFMRNPAHTGDAADEVLRLPLGWSAQIKLDDVVMTSPAVVGGRIFVVDQMGTAYGIDAQTFRILWKTHPDGAEAMGFNTSSPCVVEGRMFFGTTAGSLHILNTQNGKLLKSIQISSPVISSITYANGSIYFQALDAVLRCFDLNGNARWQWDHYARYQEPPEVTKAQQRERGHPGSYDRPHHGGGEVALSGKRVVTSIGWDIVCVEDAGTEARLVWCHRAPNGRDGAAPMSSSIGGAWVYTAGMGADGHKSLSRFSLEDGKRAKHDGGPREAYPWITPAVRGSAVTVRDASYGKNGIVLFDHAAKKALASWRDDKEATPLASSHALTRDHLVATTLRGEVIVTDLTGSNPGNGKPGAKAFRFQTPHGKGIGSSPAVANGCIYFGCDDGYFYVLSPKGDLQPKRDEEPVLHLPRARLRSATAKSYSWPSTHGNPGNTAFADDPELKPPLRLRWASRGFGHFLTPAVATATDLLTVSLDGIITCQEQATGRLRWRTQMPGPGWNTGAGLLAEGGRLYVPRPTFGNMEGAFYCLDLVDGRLLWKADIGGRYIWERAAPVLAAGKVAFGFSHKGTPPGTAIQAWDADSGKPAWRVDLNVAGNRSGSIAGCTDGKVMYFTAGAGTWQWKQEGDKQRGEAVAIDAASGKVQWRFNDRFGTTYPVLSNDQLLLNGDTLSCVEAKDGKLIWKRPAPGFSRFSVGPGFLVMRGYGGHGVKVRLEDGKDDPNCRELGGPTHACSPVALTPNFSFAITVGGLNLRDVKTGKLLWQSPGFAPRGCVNPTLANGRVFWPSAASGTIFCWEPER